MRKSSGNAVDGAALEPDDEACMLLLGDLSGDFRAFFLLAAAGGDGALVTGAFGGDRTALLLHVANADDVCLLGGAGWGAGTVTLPGMGL